MDKELHILILEDVQADAELMEYELRKAGIEFSSIRVETKEAFIKELEDFTPDLILADYSLPMFDALSALTLTKEKCPDVPFILVSGAIGEELAIEIFKRGATDYVFKNRLSRLVPAVHRALHEAVERAERKQIEEELRDSEEKLKAICASAHDVIIVMDNEGNISYWNEAAEKIFGYSPQEALGKEVHIFLAPERYHEAYRKGFSEFRETGYGPVINKTLELVAVKKDGTEFPIELSVSAVKVKGKWNAIGILRDITNRKRSEEALQKSKEELKKRVKELEEFYNMAVSRELRMIELKEAIETLKEELSKYKRI